MKTYIEEVKHIAEDMVEDYEKYVDARIYVEMEAYYAPISDFTEQQLQVLLSIAYDNIYMEYDFATPTGVGCSMGSTLLGLMDAEEKDLIDLDKDFDIEKLRQVFIEDYENGEWR